MDPVLQDGDLVYTEGSDELLSVTVNRDLDTDEVIPGWLVSDFPGERVTFQYAPGELEPMVISVYRTVWERTS